MQINVTLVSEISSYYTEMPGDFYSPFILSCSSNKLLYNGILLKVGVNDCSLCMAKYACSTVSVDDHYKDSLYICLAILPMYCITPLGITSGAVSD